MINVYYKTLVFKRKRDSSYLNDKVIIYIFIIIYLVILYNLLSSIEYSNEEEDYCFIYI